MSSPSSLQNLGGLSQWCGAATLWYIQSSWKRLCTSCRQTSSSWRCWTCEQWKYQTAMEQGGELAWWWSCRRLRSKSSIKTRRKITERLWFIQFKASLQNNWWLANYWSSCLKILSLTDLLSTKVLAMPSSTSYTQQHFWHRLVRTGTLLYFSIRLIETTYQYTKYGNSL